MSWGIYQPTLRQDIDKMVEVKNYEVLKKFIDNVFDLQESDIGHAAGDLCCWEKG